MRKSLSLLLLLPTLAFALPVETHLSDPQQEARAHALFKQLRCVVCQSESIADSPAEIARDMRKVVRQRVAKGASDQAILKEMTTHYGEFVLMRPPYSHRLLWLSPLIVLGCGVVIAIYYFRRRA